MANLELCDKHNMVAYLKKLTGSEGFQEIVDFLNGSNISNMKRGFSGEHTPLFPSILAIQAEEGEGSRHPSEPQPPSSTAQPNNEEPVPNVASSSHQKTQTPRQALNKVTELPHTSEPISSVADEAVYEETQSTVMPNVPLPQGISAGGSPRGHTLGGGEDSIELIKKLMETCTKLSKRVLALEELNTAQDLGKVTPTQVNAQGEVHSQEYKFKDQLGVLSVAKVLANAARKNVQTYTKRKKAVSTGSGEISIASRLFSIAEESASTAGASIPVSIAGMVQEVNIPSPVVVKDKGKGKMEESKDEQTKKIKLQQEQDRLGYEAAVRLQEELDEEERQRMARKLDVLRELQKHNLIMKVLRGKRLMKLQVLVEEVYVKALQVKYLIIDWEVYTEESKKYWKIIRVGNHTKAYQFFKDMLKAFDRDDLVMLWSLVKERFNSTEPTDDKERTLWVELNRLFKPDTDDTLWKL
nr:hypothetical protein [Tanacetum cinerariifolium]